MSALCLFNKMHGRVDGGGCAEAEVITLLGGERAPEPLGAFARAALTCETFGMRQEPGSERVVDREIARVEAALILAVIIKKDALSIRPALFAMKYGAGGEKESLAMRDDSAL